MSWIDKEEDKVISNDEYARECAECKKRARKYGLAVDCGLKKITVHILLVVTNKN